MNVVEALTTLGGVASRRALVSATSRGALDRALRDGAVVRRGRGTYALASTDDAMVRAHALTGVLCLTSAALHHGWAVKHVPVVPHVSVPRGRKVSAERQRDVSLHRHDLAPDDVDGIATSKEATLLQCLRTLPFEEALSIADSAARAGEHELLRRVAAVARGTGAGRVRRIAGLARSEAANPFESCLRAAALDVPGLAVEPQALITSVSPWARPDLVDRELGIALEADSFQWHGDRAALDRDAQRYNRLVVDGWILLRFTWEEVMYHPDRVRAVLVAAVALAQRRTEPSCARCRAA